METKITYDNYLFSGMASGLPTPYVSRDQNMIDLGGKRWTQLTSISLNGQITGDNFEDLVQKQNAMVSGFSRDFKSLDLQETGENGSYHSLNGFPLNNCKIDNINFDQSNYVNLINYSISISAYEDQLFSGHLGVIDPVEEIEFQESNEGIASMTHTLSARGIPTSTKNAIENAKEFVHTSTGWKNQVSPHFIKYKNFNPILSDISETINRLEGSYSVTENYQFLQTGEGTLISGVSFDIASGTADDFVTVSVSIDYKGGLTGTIDEVRRELTEGQDGWGDGTFTPDSPLEKAKLNASGVHVIAQSVSNLELNRYPKSFNIEENPKTKEIKISAQFDNNLTSEQEADFEYSVSFTTDEINGITETSVDAMIRGQGNQAQKIQNAEDFFNKRIAPYADTTVGCSVENNYSCFLWELAKVEYSNMGFSHSLNSYPTSSTISKNPLDGTISLKSSFTDKNRLLADSKNSSYNFSVVPGVLVYKPIMDILADKKYIILNTNVTKRSTLNIKAGVQPLTSLSPDITSAENALDTFISNIYNTFVAYGEDIILKDEGKSTNSVGLFSKSKNYNFHGPRIIDIPNPTEPPA